MKCPKGGICMSEKCNNEGCTREYLEPVGILGIDTPIAHLFEQELRRIGPSRPITIPPGLPLQAAAAIMARVCNVEGVMPKAKDDANPKDIAGRAKPQLHLIPSPALVEVAKVMGLGAAKYGPYNWREKPVCHTAYISAAERHERSHLDGELFDPDAKAQVYHLASAAAGLLILLDAILTGNAIDDRPKAGIAGALINPPKEVEVQYRAIVTTGELHYDVNASLRKPTPIGERIIPLGRT